MRDSLLLGPPWVFYLAPCAAVRNDPNGLEQRGRCGRRANDDEPSDPLRLPSPHESNQSKSVSEYRRDTVRIQVGVVIRLYPDALAEFERTKEAPFGFLEVF